jgi:hypothetical protein
MHLFLQTTPFPVLVFNSAYRGTSFITRRNEQDMCLGKRIHTSYPALAQRAGGCAFDERRAKHKRLAGRIGILGSLDQQLYRFFPH